MTSRIYYTDPYCRRFDAVVTCVLEHAGRPAVLLDKTAFYPTSGGQPFDTGGLSGDDGSVEVLDTVDDGDEIVHVVTRPLATGAALRGEIDWDRRLDHMQQHTGQHVLSAAFDRLFDLRTVSVHMGADVSTIDLARETSWEQITRAEDEANRIVFDNREVAIRFVSSDEAATLALRKEPARSGVLRLIDIKDFDLSACGGTHVAHTGAIGAIVVSAAEKFRGGTRITFACGGRALKVFRILRDAVASSVRVLSVSPAAMPGAIERIQGDAKDLRKTIKRFQEALASHEAVRLAAPVVVEALEGWNANGLKMIAAHITAQTSAVVALFSTSPPIAVVIARSSGLSLDSSQVLTSLIGRFGGRGGGRADLAQGGGLTGDVANILSAARELLRNADVPR